MVDDIARSLGSSTVDFIDRSIESSKRQRKAVGPTLVAATFEKWSIGSV